MDKRNCCDANKSTTNNSPIKPINLEPLIRKLDTGTGEQGKGDKACCSRTGNQNITEPITLYNEQDQWVIGKLQTPAGIVPQVSSMLSFRDTLGALKARWGINRMKYRVNPGLYAVGKPDNGCPVLVTANYKLTFDVLRKELAELDVWILVLDTKGINVWCAAGKGTFGTQELVYRIAKTRLHQVVAHRTLILPQLGAPGVSAHEVAKHSGFKVKYGPVRAKDIKEFFNAGMTATPDMRTVKFTAYDRLVLTPMELVGTFKVSLIIFGVLFLLNLIGFGPFGVTDFYAYMGAVIAGCVVTPVLLPWIPGRAFAWKGFLLGLIWAISVNMLNGWPDASHFDLLRALGYLLVLPAISAFYAMNFTGASTYTSLSGVVKEMKIAVPAIIIGLGCGIILILVNSFIKF